MQRRYGCPATLRTRGGPACSAKGRYGAVVGVPRILEALRQAQVPATFFVPGWTADNHRAPTELILRDGHEIAHHSYSHRWIDAAFPDQEVEEMERGLASLKAVGVVPKGYRSPAGETSDNLMRLLHQHGFLYDSSLQDQINPYRAQLPEGGPGPIELPWHWSLDDAPHALFAIKSPRPIFPNSHLREVFQEEFREIYRWGGLYNLVMHPQVSGRPSRVALLREMIAFIRTFPDVWFATGTEVAQAWSAAHETPSPQTGAVRCAP